MLLHVAHMCNAKVSHTCYKQTLLSTNLVDYTAYSSASTQSWMRTTVADEHKFLEVKHLSRRLKSTSVTYPTCIWHSSWGDPIRISSRSFKS